MPEYRPEPMDEEDLINIIRQAIDDGMNDEDGEVSDDREDVYDYYVGKPYGNERSGHSKVRTREVFETVEWMMPSVIRAFCSGSRFVRFEPVGPEDEAQAEQETDTISHLLMNKNDGYGAMYCWGKEALLYPTAYVELMVEERERIVRRSYENLTVGERARLLSDEDVQVIVDEEREEIVEVEGVSQPLTRYKVILEKEERDHALVWEPVPPNDIVVSANLESWNLDLADFVARKSAMTMTDLIELGVDPEDVIAGGDTEEMHWNDETVNRKFTEDENPNRTDDLHLDPSMRRYTLWRCFLRVDFDGDGVAERREVWVIGSKAVRNEVCEVQPFVAMSSLLMPHRHIGMSPAEAVMDLQLIRSTLMRQLLDNSYRLNNGRVWVSEDAMVEDTMENILDSTAEYIPVRGQPAAAYSVEQTPPIIDQVLKVIQYMESQQAERSGVAPNISLNPEVMRQSTEGAFVAALDEAAQRVELIVRTMGETGVKQLCEKAHTLCRLKMPKTLYIKLRNEYVETDPRAWSERNDLTCQVGLGHASQSRRMQMLQLLYGLQKEAMGMGMVGAEHMHATFDDFVELTDLGTTDRYFRAVDQIQPPEQKEDAAVTVAKIQAQVAQGDQQIKAQGQQVDARLRVMEQQQKASADQMRAQLEAMSQRMQMVLGGVDALVKRAQAAKLSEEARALDIENDAAETGITEVLEGITRVMGQGG